MFITPLPVDCSQSRSGQKRSKLVSPRPGTAFCELSSELAAALDRTNLSNRNAVHVLSAAARNFGHDPAELALNRESFRRARMKFREEAAKEIKVVF